MSELNRIRERYRTIAWHDGEAEKIGFAYNGVAFDPDSFHVFAGLCAVDNRQNVEKTFAALQREGVVTTRAGAYKPRTSPYDFQGLGRDCLPWVFELAGKYGIKIVAMEANSAAHVDEILTSLEAAGNPTGVMLQVGTRNAQNFELLKTMGQQQQLPVLYKRGLGLSLDDSLNACEYIAMSGNERIVFCLRGVSTSLSRPHRYFVDFAHVPVLKRLTRLLICADPSHAVGTRDRAPDGLLDIFHVSAQAVIAGVSMLLVEVHPEPDKALCDGPQALLLEELPHYLRDLRLVRETYEKRRALVGEAR